MDSIPLRCNLEALKPLFERKKISIELCQWRIPIQNDDDIVWSIVLAYLYSVPTFNDAVHMERLLAKKVERPTIKRAAKCNPFLHKDDFFRNDDMNEWVKMFRKRINDYYELHLDSFASSHTNYKCLQASSVLLSCNIILIQEPVHEASIKGFVKVFPECAPHANHPKNLIIFLQLKYSKESNKYVESFSYCIPLSIGFHRQTQALKEILYINLVPEKRKNIYKLIKSRENFTISLLQSQTVEIITFIYNSPYVLSKLRHAAIETDPSIGNKDGKSALLYALEMGKPDLLYFLLNYVVNIQLLDQVCLQHPEPIITLENIKRELKELQTKMESSCISESTKKKSLTYLSELSRVNEFQIDICRNINNIHQRVNYYYDCFSSHEAEKRKNIVVSILQIYEKYFEWEDNLDQSKNNIYEHCVYLDNLDFCFAIVFLDNFLLLMERVQFSKNLNLNFLSQLFLFVYRKRYIEKIVEKSPLLAHKILFEARLSLKNQLNAFKDALDKETIHEENEIDKLSECTIEISHNLPEFHDQMLILKLEHYLICATSKYVTDLKSILIIQRTLQVIGECIRETAFKTVQKIIPLILHEELVQNLREIQNAMAHPKYFKIQCRYITERNIELFRIIQVELNTLKSILNPMFFYQKYKNNQDYQVWLKSIRRTFEDDAIGIQNTIDFDTLIMDVTAEDVQDLNKEKIYKYMIKNLLYSIKNNINLKTKNMKSTLELIALIDDYIWSIEYLIMHIIKEQNINTVLKYFLGTLKFRRSGVWKLCISEQKDTPILRRKTQLFVHNIKILIEKILQDLHYYTSEKNPFNFQGIKELSKILLLEEFLLNTKEKNAQGSEIRFEVQNRMLSFHEEIIYPQASLEGKVINTPTGMEDEAISQDQEHLGGKVVYRRAQSAMEFYPQSTMEFYPQSSTMEFYPQSSTMEFYPQSTMAFYPQAQTTFGVKVIYPETQGDMGGKFLYPQEDLWGNVIHRQAGIVEVIHTQASLGKFKTKFDEPTLEAREPKTPFHQSEEIFMHNQSFKAFESEKYKLKSVPQKVCEVVCGNQLEFIRNRINHLRRILVYENQEVKQLWERSKCPRKNTSVQERIVHVFLNDPGIRASVEMLIFDCMNILKTKDLQNLCLKTTNLFNSINLRTLLSHGNPLLESLGRCLDPFDLPSQLVCKVLDLVSDLEIIDCLLKILNKTGNNFSKFIQIINSEEKGVFSELREKIFESDNWEQYVLLIAHDESYRSRTSESKMLTF